MKEEPSIPRVRVFSVRTVCAADGSTIIWNCHSRRINLFLPETSLFRVLFASLSPLDRRPHPVGAFRRRLPEDYTRREDALALAAEFGIILMDEHYTIIQPHARGGRSTPPPNSDNAPVVRSQGLAASFAYSNFADKSIEQDPDDLLSTTQVRFFVER
jgi:hypothetical protein